MCVYIYVCVCVCGGGVLEREKSCVGVSVNLYKVVNFVIIQEKRLTN